jgi:hypothetical protein
MTRLITNPESACSRLGGGGLQGLQYTHTREARGRLDARRQREEEGEFLFSSLSLSFS